MIKDLKQMAAGTEVKGLPLMIKTARNTFRDAEDTTFQEVVFMDSSGEMTGHILLEKSDMESHGYQKVSEFITWKSKTNLCVMDGVLQDTDERKKEGVKLVVYECFDAATPLTYEQGQEMQLEDWKKLREDEVRGKIKCLLTAQKVSTGASLIQIKEFVDSQTLTEIIDRIME